MGTRSLTNVRDSDEAILVTMYRQMDGYPTGHGAELADFLSPFTICNGFSPGAEGAIANGPGCLAAQIVEYFKSQSPLGGIYLYPPGTTDCGEEYIYDVCVNDNGILMCVSTPDAQLWAGFPEGYDGEAVEAA